MKKYFILVLMLSVSMFSHADKFVFTNANGYTLNAKGELIKFAYMVVEDDVVTAIGNEMKLGTDATVIDLKGKTLIPGLIDAHGHMLGLGQNLTQIDLRNARSEADAVNLIKQFIGNSNSSDSQWLLGRGWNQVTWPSKEFPSLKSLDRAFPDQPVYLSRVDGHAAWVNSKALEIAGISTSTPSPDGGEIVKDKDGNLSGVLIDNAMDIVEAKIPRSSTETLKYQLDTAQAHLLALGITSMHDAGISQQVRDFYINQAENGGLKIRVYAMLSATDPNIKAMLDDGHYQDAQEVLSIRSVKAYGDGALGSRGAALLSPYSDDPDNSGLLVTAQEELTSLFELVIGNEFQLNFHAIGDRANRLALQHFNQTFSKYPKNKERHRIEHSQVVAVEDIPLFKEYGVIPSMQPTHATSDKNMAQARLGLRRLKGAYAWQTFLKQGSKIAFGSDFPVELANPFHGLHAAVARQDGELQPPGGWIPEEAVSVEQAFRGFTLDAAYAGFQDDILGSLEVGKKADFVVIDRDIFSIDTAQIRSTQVLETWVNGEKVYQAE